MAKTSIEWTDESINPLRARLPKGKQLNMVVSNSGHHCVKISPGCKNCYSSRMQPRFGLPKFQEAASADVETYLDPDMLLQVLSRKKPTKWFWEDMSDMFGDWVPFEHIAACFGVMAATPWHTHQVLTKRIDRALEFFQWLAASRNTPFNHCLFAASQLLSPEPLELIGDPDAVEQWPLPNVWLGVSAENQEYADKRIPVLLQCPAAIRFVSAEPLLGPLDLSEHMARTRTLHMSVSIEGALRNRNFAGMTDGKGRELSDTEAEYALRKLLASGAKVLPMHDCDRFDDQVGCPGHQEPRIDWVIGGGESGSNARPMHPAWVRSLRDQCVANRVSFFFKQWGAWALHPHPPRRNINTGAGLFVKPDGKLGCQGDYWDGTAAAVDKVGKKAAGRSLDGWEWSQFPEVHP